MYVGAYMSSALLVNCDELFTSGAPELPQAHQPLVGRAGGRGLRDGGRAGSPGAGSFGTDSVDARGGRGARSWAGAPVRPWAAGRSRRSRELGTNSGDFSFLRRAGGTCRQREAQSSGGQRLHLWMAVRCSPGAAAPCKRTGCGGAAGSGGPGWVSWHVAWHLVVGRGVLGESRPAPQGLCSLACRARGGGAGLCLAGLLCCGAPVCGRSSPGLAGSQPREPVGSLPSPSRRPVQGSLSPGLCPALLLLVLPGPHSGAAEVACPLAGAPASPQLCPRRAQATSLPAPALPRPSGSAAWGQPLLSPLRPQVPGCGPSPGSLSAGIQGPSPSGPAGVCLCVHTCAWVYVLCNIGAHMC